MSCSKDQALKEYLERLALCPTCGAEPAYSSRSYCAGGSLRCRNTSRDHFHVDCKCGSAWIEPLVPLKPEKPKPKALVKRIDYDPDPSPTRSTERHRWLGTPIDAPESMPGMCRACGSPKQSILHFDELDMQTTRIDSLVVRLSAEKLELKAGQEPLSIETLDRLWKQ